jgi:HSP20 family protein
MAMPERDLFANFERMRREMDQLFGDWPGRSLVGARTSGFSPKVDLYYCGAEPESGAAQRAIVKVDLAGVELSEVSIEISGRELVISGQRPVQETEGRVYQQVEIDSGPFRRIVELQVDVNPERAKATYEDGILRIELPLRDQAETSRRVPIERGE